MEHRAGSRDAVRRGALVARRVVLAGAAVVVGVLADVWGGGTHVSCAPLTVAAAAGVGATLLADRLAGYERRIGFGVVGLVAAGQVVMHLALTASLGRHTLADQGAGGLGCGVIVAHAVATGLLVLLVLAAQRVLELPLAVGRRVRTFLLAGLLFKARPGDDDTAGVRTSSVAGPVRLPIWADVVAEVRPLRGPPTRVPAAA